MQPAEGFNFIEKPDLAKVSELICNTWAKPCWNYDPGLMNLHIMRPSGDPTLAVGQTSDNGDLVSFQAYMPFAVDYFGEKFNSVFASFLTVSSQYHGRGLAGPQQGILIEKAIEKDYDLYITMCEVGAPSNRAVEKIFAKKNLDVKVVNVLSYLAGINELIKPILPDEVSVKTRPYTHNDYKQISKMVPKFEAKNCETRGLKTDPNIVSLSFGSPGLRGRGVAVPGENAGEVVVVGVVCHMCKKEREGMCVSFCLAFVFL